MEQSHRLTSLRMMAWDILPTIKGDCVFTIAKKQWLRERMVQRVVGRVNLSEEEIKEAMKCGGFATK